MRKILFLLLLCSLCFSCINNEIKLKSVACFDYSPISELKTGDTITISNCSKNSSKYLWNFGDGFTSTESAPKHAYELNGSYTIKLLASNDNSSDTLSKTISINPKVKASFDYKPIIDVKVGDTISFTNSSENSTKYLWDFGDGYTSTERTPVHIYKNTGIFSIKLTVLNDYSIDTMTKPIAIRALTTSELLCSNIWSAYLIYSNTGSYTLPIPCEQIKYLYYNFKINGTLYTEFNDNTIVDSNTTNWHLTNKTLTVESSGEKQDWEIIELTSKSLKIGYSGTTMSLKPKN